MDKRELGSTGIKISPIVFGAWAIGGWMWGGTDEKKSAEAILASIDAGVDTIDTAAIYGQGLSEEIIGKTLGPRRKDVKILTKFGIKWDDTRGKLFSRTRLNSGKKADIHLYASKESVISECEDSLRRLKTDYIDLYQHHRPDVTTPIEETMEAMEILLKQGKILSCGVSKYSREQWLQAEKTVEVCSNQLPFNMLERNNEKDNIDHAVQNSKSILAYSPMQRGILAGKITLGHKFHRMIKPGLSLKH